MTDSVFRSYIGGFKWKFSDLIYYRLTKERIKSNYFPIIPIQVRYLPDLIPNKKLFGLFWGTPTFKDTDCQYLFHIYDEKEIDYIISTSSGNTVESMARSIKIYNEKSKKNIKAILLVPELSSFKVSRSVIENNPYVKFIVLKNSTLDSTRNFAAKLKKEMLENLMCVSADLNLKTAAYSQIGLALDQMNLLNDDLCYVQTVSGGLGPAGFIEYAYLANLSPEVLVIQPLSSMSTPIIDALTEHSLGHDPFGIFKKKTYVTSDFEPTLGSTKPIYAIEKFIRYRENGGRILTLQVSKETILNQKNNVLKTLINAKIYPTLHSSLFYLELEKSGLIAFVGAINAAKNIESETIIVNFTGRYPENNTILQHSATPHLYYDPKLGITKLIKILDL
ncbi:MAG: hypothetical protein ACFFA6_10635 [Promethearchaeota archaeon]